MIHKINKSIHYLRDSLKNSHMVKMTSEGIWEGLNSIRAFALKTAGLEESHWRKTSEQLRKQLAIIESVPVLFSENESEHIDYKSLISSVEEVLRRLSTGTSSKTTKEFFALKREFLALLYRLEGVNGGLDPSPITAELLDELLDAARSWKVSLKIFSDEELSPAEVKVLRETSRYPRFVDLLLSDSSLLSLFFSWSLRDLLPIRSFIEFPSLSGKILDVGLNGRIGRIGGHLLSVHKVCHLGSIEKIVTLPVEGKEVSLLDESKFVILRGNYALTIGEIFNIFRNKHFTPGNIEFMKDGIVNWNTFNWGWWDANLQDYHLVDLNQADWWKELPLQEVLTLKQARKKFGPHLDGRQWNFATISTRSSPTLDYEKSHAYTSIAIPQDDGHYAVYAFGKYATWLPSSYLEAAMNFGQTTHATIAYPDENIYYTHRQKARYSFALNEEEGLKYLASVKHDMLLSREGHFAYQITSDNCAKWSYEKVMQVVGHHRVPNLFLTTFLEAEPFGFMARVFAIVKSLPKSWQVPVTTFFHRPFSAGRGVWIIEKGRYLWKSLTHHAFWEDTVIYLPAMLHRQQEIGMIDRFVPQGVTFTMEVLRTSYHQLSHKMARFASFVEVRVSHAIHSLVALFRESLSFLPPLITLNIIQFLCQQSEIKSFFSFQRNDTGVSSLGMAHALT